MLTVTVTSDAAQRTPATVSTTKDVGPELTTSGSVNANVDSVGLVVHRCAGDTKLYTDSAGWNRMAYGYVLEDAATKGRVLVVSRTCSHWTRPGTHHRVA